MLLINTLIVLFYFTNFAVTASIYSSAMQHIFQLKKQLKLKGVNNKLVHDKIHRANRRAKRARLIGYIVVVVIFLVHEAFIIGNEGTGTMIRNAVFEFCGFVVLQMIIPLLKKGAVRTDTKR